MIKKLMTVLIVLAFVGGSLLFMVSCASQQVDQEEETPTETVQPTTEEAPPPSPPPTPQVETARPMEQPKQPVGTTPLPPTVKPVETTAMPEPFPNEKIFFDYDKAKLKAEARAVLLDMAEWLEKNPAYFLRIEGHCDERGTNEYNLALGERRARVAEIFLNDLGISSTRTTSLSYGEERPVDPDHNEEAWAQNRRDEFTLLK